jgi:threonine aldolase
MHAIDLRSDTVTRPTPEMWEAMASAQVGDDVYGEDPTVNRLEELAAEMTGHQAGLFVPSGTMGNLAAMLAHCGRGDEIIVGDKAHTFMFEAGGVSALGGIHSCQLPNQPDGTLLLDDIEAAVRFDDPHCPVTRVIALENTHNMQGGVPLDAEYTRAVREIADRHHLKLHLDGARIWNAAVALGVPGLELAAPAHSVTFCLSKSLCAPVGSVLCGDGEFIGRARRARKQLGGGMRQAGIVAAAGIVALESMVERLAEDHARARALSAALAAIPGLRSAPATPSTNMVYLNIEADVPAPELAERLAKRDVLVGPLGPERMRLVTHYWIDDDSVERTVRAFAEAL